MGAHGGGPPELPSTPGSHRPPVGIARRAEFVAIQGGGQAHRGRLMCLLVAVNAASPAPRVGYTVSRRVGNAVVRNRVRRRLQAIVRTSQELLQCHRDHVWIAFGAAAQAPFAALSNEVGRLLRRAATAPSPRP